jgi:DNA-binding transcriptional MerR regulator
MTRRSLDKRPSADDDARADNDAATAARGLRIGDVARTVGTTTRTIRYYEEIGLLPRAAGRPSGSHRLYSASEVERLREVMRLKDLLGVSLDELKTLLTAEEARAAVRAQLRRDDVDPARRRQLLAEALGHIERQLALVRRRAQELAKLERELDDTRKRVRRKIRELDAREGGEFAPLEESASGAEQRIPARRSGVVANLRADGTRDRSPS